VAGRESGRGAAFGRPMNSPKIDSDAAPGRDVGWGVTLWGARAVDQALRDPVLRVAGRDIWHDDPRVQDLVDRMPSMHDDPARRRALIQVRALMSPDASRAAAAMMRVQMRDLARDAVTSEGPEVDLVDRFTSLIAPTFLRQHLGLSEILSALALRSFSVALGAELVNRGKPDPQRVASILAVSEALRAFAALLRSQPLDEHPLSDLVAHVPDDRDVAAVIALLASGGQETVSSLTCSVILALSDEHSTACTWETDPVSVVDDLAGRRPPITMLARVAAEATQADGVAIDQGRIVMLQLDREAAEAGLAFGMGLHRCLGRNFARMVIPIAVNELRAVWPCWPPEDLHAEGGGTVPVFRGPARMFARSADPATPMRQDMPVSEEQGG